MASVDIVSLSKKFGDHRILKDINLSIGDGEFVALVGPSGCGKSTLLRIISGLEPVTSGIIAFDGKPINHLSPQARNVAMVFQSYALYPHFTVRENIAFGLKQMKLPKDQIELRIDKAARVLGLMPYLDRLPKQLSGGQRQRVAMGRAMVREPVVLLLDEPLSNLDAQLRVSMRAEIRQLQEQLGVTTIYVTHDQVEAITMADKIVLMNAGEIVQVGQPLQLYDRPATRFVAGFIGSPAMNFFDATRVSTGLQTADGSVLPLPLSRADAKAELTVGLRPEHLKLIDRANTISLAFDAVVRRHESLGAEVEIHVDAFGTRLLVRHFSRHLPAVGSHVRIGFNSDRVHLFDRATGHRIVEHRPVEPADVWATAAGTA
jgi:ABC-type sugar transport system ATPase subunit